MRNEMLRIILIAAIFAIWSGSVQAAPCGACKGCGTRQYWKTCEKCGGSGTVHFTRMRYGSTRIFHDGMTGQGVTRCSLCQYGLGNKRNGMVLIKEKCKLCGGTGVVDGPVVNEVVKVRPKAKDKKQMTVRFDAEAELARQNINTNAFVSYNCRYRKECEHCRRLAQKNGLTKSYCEQCYVCKKKRQEKAAKDKAFKEELEAYDKMLKDLQDDEL